MDKCASNSPMLFLLFAFATAAGEEEEEALSHAGMHRVQQREVWYACVGCVGDVWRRCCSQVLISLLKDVVSSM
jgi:hypothetical protein